MNKFFDISRIVVLFLGAFCGCNLEAEDQDQDQDQASIINSFTV
jgi:hypothetical protein